MTRTDQYESFQELHDDQFETIEQEHDYFLQQLHETEAEFQRETNYRRRGKLICEINEIRGKLGKLKPHLKNERRVMHGKLPGQRTRHDVMEDMLFELKEIKRLLQQAIPTTPASGPESEKV